MSRPSIEFRVRDRLALKKKRGKIIFDRDCCRYRGPTSDSGRTGQMLIDWTDRLLVKSAQHATGTLELCTSQFC